MRTLGWLCVLGSVFSLGCSAADDGPIRDFGGITSSGGVAPTGGADASGGTSDPLQTGGIGPSGGTTLPPLNTGGGGPQVEEGECGQKVTAPPPADGKVDIVWVVDASGSMLDEQIKIGQNITQFADDITSAAVDVRIVMLTTSAAIPVICEAGDPDPAANTALAGDPRYRFIQANVDSTNPLDIAVDMFGQYRDFLRPGAATHFIFVSDDESSYRALPDVNARATTFQADMQGLLGLPFFVHTISSEGPTACNDPMCMPDPNSGLCVFVMLGCGASAPGSTYWELASRTGGLTASICQQDWSNIFEPLTEAIVTSVPLPCNYPIPAPPPDQIFDRSKVNLEFTAVGAAMADTWPRVVGGADACGDNLAWHFDTEDRNPKELRLCPKACELAEAGGGSIDVSFGCVGVILE